MIKLLINGHLVQLSAKDAEELQIDIQRQLMEHYDTMRIEQCIEPGILYSEE